MARIIGKGYSLSDVVIVPKYNKINSRKDVDFSTKVTRNFSIGIPILAANMDTICESKMAIALGRLGGLGVIHRFMTISDQCVEVKKVKEAGLLCAAAVGIKNYWDRVKVLVESGVDIVVLDIAHGHSKRLGRALDWIKSNYPNVDVVAGNIATKDAAEYFISKGADAVKVGIGPGSLCTTRVMTGVGVPQITAIFDVYEATQGRIPLIADGGIKHPGDMAKVIGAGASCIMGGSIFAGSDETPGELIEQDGKKFKKYQGMASYDATIKKQEIDGERSKEIISIEGEKTIVEHKGPIEPIIKKFLGGLASGMTYVGADKIEKLCGKADFFQVTTAGRTEGQAHLLTEQ